MATSSGWWARIVFNDGLTVGGIAGAILCIS
jgi:hypothetical protein